MPRLGNHAPCVDELHWSRALISAFILRFHLQHLSRFARLSFHWLGSIVPDYSDESESKPVRRILQRLVSPSCCVSRVVAVVAIPGPSAGDGAGGRGGLRAGSHPLEGPGLGELLDPARSTGNYARAPSPQSHAG